MVTKFKQKSTKIALNTVLCKKSRIFPVNSRVFGVRELKYAINIFKGAKGVARRTMVFRVCEFKYAI